MTDKIVADVEAVFREVFDVENLQFSPEMQRSDQSAWDSLGHIRLISAIEEKFDLTFSLDEIDQLDSVPKFVKAIAERLK